MRVIGIDLSTCTGVAIVDSGKQVKHAEEIEFKKATGFDRICSIAIRIMELRNQFNPDFAVIEGYGFGNAHTLATLVEIGTVVRYFLWQENYPYLLVPPNSLKKFATGSGNAKKEMMILEVFKQWGFTAKTNNIADAVCLGMFGLACGSEPFTINAKKAVQEVLKGQQKVADFIGQCK